MRALVILVAVLIVGGCAAPRRHAHPWTDQRFNNNPSEFHFAIVGDRTGQHRPGVFENGIDKLNLLRPDFVVSVGDLIEGYTRDEAEIDQQWDEIERFTAKLAARFFYVPGNHDLSNPIQARKWRERFGPAYYQFVYRDVLFLCINTYDPEQRISLEQIAFIRKTLARNKAVRWTCVFMHEPLWDYKKPTGWAEVEQLLSDRPYTVFAGHYHAYTKYVRNDRRYIVLATTGGGTKNGLTGPELGSFDHITWVTMLPDGPRIANIAIDAIYNEDVRTEQMANLIDRVMRGQVLEISPVLTNSATFERAKAVISVKNDSDVPMSARGDLIAKAPLRATPATFEIQVQPHSAESLEVQLLADPATAIAMLAPVCVNWTATYRAPGRPAVNVPRQDLIAVEASGACPARSSPVTIDGSLDEWSQFPFAGPAQRAEDCSYRFAVEHDGRFVYIAVQTRDDRAVLNPLKEPWSQDGIEVRLDARAEPMRSQGRGYGEFREILVVSMSPGVSAAEMVTYNAADLPSGVNAVCVKTKTGHNTEIAIPVSYLDDKQGGRWNAFRLNIAVDDFDDPAGPLKALWWKPDWRSAQTYAGSGTFERK